jgi:uncharacterized protein (DUF1800 family)
MATTTESQAWTPYRPREEVPWGMRRVVHLHRRAGFAATWRELRRDLDGPGAALDRLLHGDAYTSGVPNDFDAMSRVIGDAAVASDNVDRLKAWWIYRMLFGPDPLTERLALVWHDHFATSNLKVNNLAMMRRQNELFRKFGRAPFAELLKRVARDPALLVWLDAPTNRKGHANENLAREIMELFTLGIGHYTEDDIKEAARALTGWSVVSGDFREVTAHHDDGEKTIFGQKGKWNGDDLVRMLLEHPATADRLAWRICDAFLGEGVAGTLELSALADGLRQRDLDIGWAVETVLRSEAFFSKNNLRSRVLSPVGYVVGAVRALEMFDPPPSTLILAEWADRIGQDLFYPPNVGGWPGGRAWLTTRSIVGRTNFATALVDGKLAAAHGPFDAVGLARRHGRDGDLDDAICFYGELLLGGEPSADWLQRTRESIGTSADEEETLRRAVAVILASPEAQIG